MSLWLKDFKNQLEDQWFKREPRRPLKFGQEVIDFIDGHSDKQTEDNFPSKKKWITYLGTSSTFGSNPWFSSLQCEITKKGGKN